MGIKLRDVLVGLFEYIFKRIKCKNFNSYERNIISIEKGNQEDL